MYRSKDGLFHVDVVLDISNIVMSACDISVLPALPDADKHNKLTKVIKNSPTYKHLTLFLNREKKQNHIKVLQNISNTKGLTFSDQVVITYPTTNNKGSGLTQLAETGWLFYKEGEPTYSETRWFREGYTNASNLWDLDSYQDTGDKALKEKTVTLGRFSWELALLLLTAAHPLEFRAMTWGFASNDENLHRFARAFNVKVYSYASSHEEALKSLNAYESCSKESA